MMTNLTAAFTDHPRSVGESYWEHLLAASSFAGRLALAAIACFLHALLPFLFVKTGSRMIDDLHNRMVRNRTSQREQSDTHAVLG